MASWAMFSALFTSKLSYKFLKAAGLGSATMLNTTAGDFSAMSGEVLMVWGLPWKVQGRLRQRGQARREQWVIGPGHGYLCGGGGGGGGRVIGKKGEKDNKIFCMRGKKC